MAKSNMRHDAIQGKVGMTFIDHFTCLYTAQLLLRTFVNNWLRIILPYNTPHLFLNLFRSQPRMEHVATYTFWECSSALVDTPWCILLLDPFYSWYQCLGSSDSMVPKKKLLQEFCIYTQGTDIWKLSITPWKFFPLIHR